MVSLPCRLVGWVTDCITGLFDALLPADCVDCGEFGHDECRYADALADAEAETEVWTSASLKALRDAQWPHGAYFTCLCGHQAQQHPHTDDGQLWRPCTLCECTILTLDPKYRKDPSPSPQGDAKGEAGAQPPALQSRLQNGLGPW